MVRSMEFIDLWAKKIPTGTAGNFIDLHDSEDTGSIVFIGKNLGDRTGTKIQLVLVRLNNTNLRSFVAVYFPNR